MEKYKYCNIEPMSSPQVEGGGREKKKGRQEGHGIFGGMVAQEGEATHVKGTCFCFFLLFCGLRGCCVRKNRERNARIRVYVYVYNNHIFHI